MGNELSKFTAAKFMSSTTKEIAKKKVTRKKNTSREELGAARVQLDVLERSIEKIFNDFSKSSGDAPKQMELQIAYNMIALRWVGKGIMHISDVLSDDILMITDDGVNDPEEIMYRSGVGEALDNLTYGFQKEEDKDAKTKLKDGDADDNEEDGDSEFIGIPGSINYMLSMISSGVEMLFDGLCNYDAIEKEKYEPRLFGDKKENYALGWGTKEAADKLSEKYAD